MRYLEGPRKRQYDSDDNHTASSPRRREPTSPVLLKRRKAKQAAEEGTKYLFNTNNATHLKNTRQFYLASLGHVIMTQIRLS